MRVASHGEKRNLFVANVNGGPIESGLRLVNLIGSNVGATERST